MHIQLDSNDPFERALVDIVQTHRRKKADYEVDGEQWSNFADTSHMLGVTMWEVCDMFEVTKLSRLRALKTNDRAPLNESYVDSYLDKAVYALIAYAMVLEASGDGVECIDGADGTGPATVVIHSYTGPQSTQSLMEAALQESIISRRNQNSEDDLK